MQRLRDLVVVVPGIGGSTLTRPDGSTWEPTGKGVAATLVRPTVLDLHRFPNLEPAGLTRTFTVFGPQLAIHGYDNLHTLLTRNFRDVVTHTYRQGVPVPPSTDVLLFPYDFRRSIRDAAEHLAAAIHDAALGAHRRVVVLAHSMGGLVARYWIGPLGGWKVCRALLTLGTPHRGAPKAIEWLVRGPGVGPLWHPGVRRVLREWPSMYELLPQYPAVWDEATGREIELTSLRPSTYAAQFARMAATARRTHEEIFTAWAGIPEGSRPDVVPYFGRGHTTLNEVLLRKDGTLDVRRTDPPWRGNVGWAGDGTVPALSAIPRELSDDQLVWRTGTDRHGPIAHTPAMVELLTSYAGDPVPTRGEAVPKPWLGFDVEDIVPAGVETAVGVTVQPLGTEAAEVRLSLDSGFTAAMSLDGDRWSAALPPLKAGRHELCVEARQVGGRSSVFASADLVALDPGEAWS